MITDEQILQIHADPKVTGVFSDATLVELARGEQLDEDERTAVMAELWTRKWLYQGDCPTAIHLALTIGSRPGCRAEFHKRFARDLIPLRTSPRSDLIVEGIADPQESAIWEELVIRVRAFCSADGLIAVVPLGAHDEQSAVALPFRLEPGVGITDGRNRPLTEWTDDLKRVARSHPIGFGFCVQSVFPAEHPPQGQSLGLPLVLARERIGGRLEWFRPLDLLATGAIVDGIVDRVEGVPAKQRLARRIGCAIFVAPHAREETDALALEAGATISQVLAKVRARGLTPVDSLGAASEILRRYEQELPRWRRLEGDVPEWRLSEMDRLLTFAFDALMAAAPDSAETSKVRVCLRRVRSDLASSAVALDMEEIERSDFWVNRRRRLYGRTLLAEKINRFLTERPGGMLLVTGKAGYGKTTLLTHCIGRYIGDGRLFNHFFRAESHALRSLSGFCQRLAFFVDQKLPELYRLGRRRIEGEPVDSLRHLLLNYGELSDKERPELVILIDGLDEASEPYFPSFFPFSANVWPAGLHVIASLRTPEGDGERIRTWTKQMTEPELNLASLPVDAVGEWASHELGGLANAPGFLSQLYDKTEGCALYIEDLLQEFKERKHLPDFDWITQMEDTPKGYANRIRRQYDMVFRQPAEGVTRIDLELFQKLVKFCTVAHDQLDETDVHELLGTPLIPDFGELPRWISRTPVQSNRGRLFRFSNQLIKDALLRGDESQGKLALQDVQFQLLRYCRRRSAESPRSPYALRHVLTHLAEASHADLYVVARDPSFLAAYAELHKAEPTSVLHPLEVAMRHASTEGDVFHLAQFSLKRAAEVSRLLREHNPRRTLHTVGLKAALRIIPACERSADQVLWYLLLAADCLLQDDHAQARSILDAHLPAELCDIRFEGDAVMWVRNLLIWFLSTLEMANASVLVRLLPPDDQRLVRRVVAAARARPPRAAARAPTLEDLNRLERKLTRQTKAAKTRAWGIPRVLAAAAVAIARHGHRDMAYRAFDLARRRIETGSGKPAHMVWAYLNLAEAQGQAGFDADAEQTLEFARTLVGKVVDGDRIGRPRLLAEIARAAAEILGPETAKPLFDEAMRELERPQAISNGRLLAGWGEIVELSARTGLLDVAMEAFHSANRIVRRLQPMGGSHWKGLAELALSFAKASQHENRFSQAAHQCAQMAVELYKARRAGWDVDGPPPFEMAKRVHSLRLALNGKITDAVLKARSIKSRELRSPAMRDIAIICIQRNEFGSFSDAVSGIGDRRSEVLPDIGVELVKRRERMVFPRILWLCSDHLDSSFRMVALLILHHQPDLDLLNRILELIDVPPLTDACESPS